ncbi:MAG TPA: hypothetical protein ENK57_01190 [Polyangiaceae bacterium]|nr:hypothetical protein [Polyangiaceae bacterium]
MAKLVLKNAYVSINNVDLSQYVRSVTLETSKDTPDSTTMGLDSKEFLAGLRDGSITVEFVQDDAAGAVSATLWGVYTSDNPVPFEVRPKQTAVATDNPKYTGSCHLGSFTPIGGSVGDVGMNPTTFQITGDVTRATS